MSDRPVKGMITRFDAATGANLGSVSVHPDIAPPAGEIWKNGVHEGNLNLATNRVVKPKAAALRRSLNCLRDIPDGAKVIVNGQLAQPVNGELPIDVEWDEDVHVSVTHPLHGHSEFTLPCKASANAGGHKAHPDHAADHRRLRIGGYAEVASFADQFDALWKIMPSLLDLLSPEQLEQIDPGARAVVAGMAEVKARIQKKGTAK